MVINARQNRYRVEDINAIYQLLNNGQAKERRKKMIRTDEPTRDFLAFDAEMDARDEAYINSLEKCCECGEPLYNPYYKIGSKIYFDYYCENCISNMRVDAEPPVVERNF